MVRKQPKPSVKFAVRQCSKLEESKASFDKVFITFKRHYKLVPLEVFADDPYKTLISTLLSSRTNDNTTLKSSLRLFAVASNLTKLRKLPQMKIQKLIYPVGFYKTKAKHIKKLSGMIDEVPKTREKLMNLPGVGRKTANLVLNRAFKIPAIAVDTHVHRISNMLGWVNTKTPEQTEKKLNEILPKKYWSDTNRLLVSIGRQFTTTKRLKQFLGKNDLI